MDKLFFPESIVVFGVSPVQANLAKHTVMNLGLFKYPGRVYCVGRDDGEVFGKKIYRSVAEIGSAPDLAVFLIPAKSIPGAMEECGKAGIRRCIIQSGGFSEYADSGRSLEQELLDTASLFNMRFAGPNCVGIMNMENGMVLPFFPLDPAKMKKGPVSVLAQSGGVVIDCMRLFELDNIGFSKMVSMGNKLNVDENDYLEYLLGDPDTRTIILHLESVSDGGRLMDLAGATTKPIVAIKANTSPGGREVARFHTSALAGDDEIATAAFRQAGIHRLPNLHEAVEFAKVLSLPPMKGKNLAVLCRSGGQAVIVADAAHKYGFSLARFSDEFFSMVLKECRAGVIKPTHPLDLGDIFDLRAYVRILEKALSQDNVDGAVLYHGYLGNFEMDSTRELVKATREITLKYGKPVLLFIVSDKEAWFSLKELTDFPIFSEPDAAMMSLARSLEHNIRTRGKARVPTKFSDRPKPVNGSRTRPLGPSAVYSLLGEYGLPVVPYTVVTALEECLRGAEGLGYPVALKMGSAEILHKTEQKGVALDIRDAGSLEKEFKSMQARQGGGSLVLQKMSPPGRELIIGGKRDPEFGPVVVFGLGGVLVEVLRDVSLRVAPVTPEEAAQMIEEIKGRRILADFRGRPAADTAALADFIRKISLLITEHPEVKGIDVNPLILFDSGQGGVVVDAKIEITEG
jgi:acetate---CoA ligase (ADP-forming)